MHRFWLEPSGGIFFLLDYMVSNNHVATNALARVSTHTAAAARLLPTAQKQGFEAGSVQLLHTRDSRYHCYRERSDHLTSRFYFESGTVLHVYDHLFSTHDFGSHEEWHHLAHWASITFMKSYARLMVKNHPLANSSTTQVDVDRFNDRLALPDYLHKIFGRAENVELSSDIEAHCYLTNVSLFVEFFHNMSTKTVQEKRRIWELAMMFLKNLTVQNDLQALHGDNFTHITILKASLL